MSEKAWVPFEQHNRQQVLQVPLQNQKELADCLGMSEKAWLPFKQHNRQQVLQVPLQIQKEVASN
eukprot:1156662-Pelagomonas_calceolata.AAC.18